MCCSTGNQCSFLLQSSFRHLQCNPSCLVPHPVQDVMIMACIQTCQIDVCLFHASCSCGASVHSVIIAVFNAEICHVLLMDYEAFIMAYAWILVVSGIWLPLKSFVEVDSKVRVRCLYQLYNTSFPTSCLTCLSRYILTLHNVNKF